MRKLIIILAVLTFSCVNKKSRFVDVSNINEIIKIKMSKKELIEKIGTPAAARILSCGLRSLFGNAKDSRTSRGSFRH